MATQFKFRGAARAHSFKALACAALASTLLPVGAFAGNAELGGPDAPFSGATATGDGSVSVGAGTNAGAPNVNTPSNPNGIGVFINGADGAYTENNYAVAIGSGSSAGAGGYGNLAVGSFATAFVGNGTDDEAPGYDSRYGDPSFSTAVGYGSYASGQDSTAIGGNAWAEFNQDTAVGTSAYAGGPGSTALGWASIAGDYTAENGDGISTNATALGKQSVCNYSNSTAIGAHAVCANANELVLGAEAGENGVGTPATSVRLPGSLNVGGSSNFSGDADFNGDVEVDGDLAVLGDTYLAGDNVTIGNVDGDSTVTIPGIARRGGKRFMTVNSNGTVGSSKYTIANYDNALELVDDQVNSVGAMAAALSSIPTITTGEKNFACGIGTGAFGSAWAGAVGCVGRVASNVWVNGALSFTPSVTTEFGSSSSVGGRLGVFFQF